MKINVPIILMILLFPGAFHNYIHKHISFSLFSAGYLSILFLWISQKFNKPVKKDILNYLLFFYVLYCSLHIVYVFAGEVEWLEYFRYYFVFLSLLLFYPISSTIKNYNNVRFLVKGVVYFSSLICLVILFSNLSRGAWGRVDDGLYFSTIYIFVTIISVGFWLTNSKILGKFELLFIIAIHIARSLIDVRRSPVIIIFLGILILLLIFLFSTKHKKTYCSTGSGNRNRPLFLLLLVSVSPILFISYNLNYLLDNLIIWDKFLYRFSIEAIKLAFDVRYQDFLHVFQDNNLNLIIGAGLGRKFELQNTADIHSLYVFMLVNLGLIGFGIFIFIVARIIQIGLSVKRLTKFQEISELCTILNVALISYLIFFLLSARGTEYEVFFILGYVAAIQFYLKKHNNGLRKTELI